MFSWDDCPTEIMCLIFKLLRTDTKALTTCMEVSRKWQDMAKHIAEHYSLWPTILKNEVINDAETFINKTTHKHLRDLYKNVVLWKHLQVSDMQHICTYECPGIRNIQVLKGKMIITHDKKVVGMKLTASKTTRSNRKKCLNYEENDCIVAGLVREEDLTYSLHVYRKPYGLLQVLLEVKLYKLTRTCCYVYTIDDELWCYAPPIEIQPHPDRWHKEFRGRHYGNTLDVVTSLHICNQQVYVMTKYGTVWSAKTEPARFEKVYSYHVPINLNHHNWVMFDNFNVIASVKKTDGIARVTVYHDVKARTMMMKCQDLTCAKQHGPVLFLGYKDGTVEIRNPSNHVPNSNYKNAGKSFSVWQKPGDDPKVIAIDVMEVDNGHYIFVSTRKEVFKCHITYPVSVLQML